jgi:N-acetylglucosaminyl-diphospho-decaprenol L-rhamnosyltransferase
MTNQDGQEYVDCSVIIVTYNSARYIDGLLASLPAAAAGLTLRTIVVDNGSADDTVARVRIHPGVICVETGANLGYSGGINVGRTQAGECGSVAILNPDLTMEPGSLREMFSALDDPAVGVVVPMLLDFDGRLDLSLRREPTLLSELGDALFGHNHFRRRPAIMSDLVQDKRQYEHRHVVDWATGAVMLVSADCDRKIGAWDESFFLYMEEVDYAARVRDAGFLVLYAPQARVRHLGGGSSQSTKLIALGAVSRVRYFEKRGDKARMFRAAVCLNQLLRSVKPARRAALRAVARRSTWEPLILELKNGAPARRDVNPKVDSVLSTESDLE